MDSGLRHAIAILSIVAALNSHASDIQFVDVTEHAGIQFEHAGGIDMRVVPALTGSGAAWRDYNNDGWLDLYIVNSALVRPAPDAVLPKNTLYRNNGDGTFTDVTETAEVGDTGAGDLNAMFSALEVVPAMNTAVDAKAKLTTTWGALKGSRQ